MPSTATTDMEETKTDSTTKPNAKQSAEHTKLDNTSKEEETKADRKSKSKPNPDESDCEEDSDSDCEEDKAKEMEERKKLHQETEQHKTKMVQILFVLIAIEVIICSILLSPPSGVQIEDKNNYFRSRILNFRHDTVDIVLASIFRLFMLYGFVCIAISWGNVKTYDPDLDKHTIFNTNASHYKLITKIKANAAYIILTAWKYIIGLNESHDASVNNNGFTSLLLQQNDDIHPANNMTFDRNKKMKRKKLFDLKEFVNKYAGMEAQDVADVWKTVLWMLLFFSMTVCTTIIGIKISFFQCINNDPDMDSYYYYIALFASIIILTHIQTYFIKKYIDDCCEPLNRYLDINIHPHPVFKTKNRGRYCQLCWQRPGRHSTERKLIFKCSQCPRHRAFVCIKCWNKKKKEARLREKEKEDKMNDDPDKDVTFREYFTTLLKYHLPYIRLLLLGVVAMALCSVINIFVPKQKGQLLDRLISGDIDGFYLAIKMQIILTVTQGVVSSISAQSMNVVSQQITCDLQKRMFSNLMAQDMVFFDNHTTTEIRERMNWGLSEMLSPFQSTIRTVLSSCVSLFGSVYMCLMISWRLTFLGMSTLGPMSYFMNLFARWNWQRNLVQQELQREMYAISYQGFEHIRSVRAFAKEHEFVRYYSMLRQESHDTDNRKRMSQSVNSIINSWFKLGTKLLLTWIAGMIILNNSKDQDSNNMNDFFQTNLTVGLFITFETYWQQLYGTIQSIRGTYSTYDHAFFMAKKIFRTLEKKPEIEHLATNIKEKELLNEVDGNIKFENVEFYYESAPNKLVLKSINFEIEKGKTVALVGRSGGGKSTIMHLLLRFYDPTKGRITINNINLNKYNPYCLRRQIALVSQDTELFTKSVEYNIGFGANNKSNNAYESAYNLKQVQYSAKLANAHKFISEMEDKYDTQMGTRAKRCSGGQKQRISIARMLMSKAKVMLLDEATSSLDAESEALVQAAMERESEEKNCTLVIVAHRLSTVVNADKICVVDDGTIVEQGTHEQLIDLQGIYASLVERQINLRTKMKQKLENMKKEKDGDCKMDDENKEKEDEHDDYDNIDSLIDRIKADKAEKAKMEIERKNEKDVINTEELKT